MPSITTVRAGGLSLIQRIGRRGAYLIFLALLDIIYAYALATPTERSLTNSTTIFLISIMPLSVWAVIWGVIGTACLICAFQTYPVDIPAYLLSVGLKAFWALVFGLGQLIGKVERGYLSTAIWGAFAAVTVLIAGWRENNEH